MPKCDLCGEELPKGVKGPACSACSGQIRTARTAGADLGEYIFRQMMVLQPESAATALDRRSLALQGVGYALQRGEKALADNLEAQQQQTKASGLVDLAGNPIGRLGGN